MMIENHDFSRLSSQSETTQSWYHNTLHVHYLITWKDFQFKITEYLYSSFGKMY